MKTEMLGRKPVTRLQPDSKRKLLYIIQKLAPHAETPALGQWEKLSDESLWGRIVSQVCVMGSAVPMEKLNHSDDYDAFNSALSLSVLSTKRNKSSYIAEQLEVFKATRFHNRAAQRLKDALNNSNIVRGNRIVLLDGLPLGDRDAIRDELLERTKGLFKYKSVSDLMISIGLSHDVIALDQRVVGVLKTYLGYNREPSNIQTSRSIYLSVESCLRGVCEEANISLGNLDRMLFRFAGLSAIDYFMAFDPDRQLSGC